MGNGGLSGKYIGKKRLRSHIDFSSGGVSGVIEVGGVYGLGMLLR